MVMLGAALTRTSLRSIRANRANQQTCAVLPIVVHISIVDGALDSNHSMRLHHLLHAIGGW